MFVFGRRVAPIVLLSVATLLFSEGTARSQVSAPPTRFRAVDLGLPEADGVAVTALNRRGQITAYTWTYSAETQTYTYRCWLYDNGVLTNLGSLGGQICVPTALNDSGQVAGHATTPDGHEHPFIYSGGLMKDIGLLTADADGVGFAYGINSSGAVVGQSGSPAEGNHAFLYENGDLRAIDPSSPSSAALAINDAGQITGVRSLPDGTQTAYRYQNGIVENISAPGPSIGRLINAAGDVTGEFNVPPGRRAFLFTKGTVHDLGTFGGDSSYPLAMNDSGQVAGYAFISETRYHAMIARDGALLDLGSLAAEPDDLSYARSINASGHVVGWTKTRDGSTGFFSTGAGLHDLSTLLTLDSAAGVTDPLWINDAGQIAATGYVGGRLHAFLLSPVAVGTELAIAPVTVRYGTRPQLSATLTSGSTPLAQKTVTFAIDGVSAGSATTDDNGVAQFTITSQTTSTGDHTVSAAFADDGLYTSSESTATLTVLKAHARLVVTGGTFTYDGQPHPATATATGVFGETLADGVLVSYGSANGSAAPVGAGTYSANVQFSGDTNYEPDTASAVITVLRAPLTVTANDASKLLGAPNPAFAASYTGFVAGETPAILSGTLTFATAGTVSSPVGRYAITPSGLSSPNYDIHYVDGTLTITYNICVGFDQTRAARAGSVIPIKLDLCSASGIGSPSPSVVLKTKTLVKLSSTASTDVQDAGDANPDSDFRYVGPGYIFNLQTTGLTTGTWDLVFTVTGDPLEHDVRFQVR
jgi:probable HAF family extracellular repeat protein